MSNSLSKAIERAYRQIFLIAARHNYHRFTLEKQEQHWGYRDLPQHI